MRFVRYLVLLVAFAHIAVAAAFVHRADAASAVNTSNLYTVNLYPDPVARTVTVKVHYPAHDFSRTARIEILKERKVIWDSSRGVVDDPVGATMKDRTYVMPTGGKLEPGTYYVRVKVTDINGEVVSDNTDREPVTSITDQGQAGACSVGTIRKDADKGIAYVEYDFDGATSFNWISDYLDIQPYLDDIPQQSIQVNKNSGKVQVQFNGLFVKRVYGAKLVLVDLDVKCENSFTIDMSTTGSDETNPTPTAPVPSQTPTEPTGQGAFTWLSGECIRHMEDLSLEAIPCVIGNTIKLLLSLVGIVSTGLVVYGGFTIARAADDDTRKKGKRIIAMALAGLVLVLFSFIIIQVILGGGIL